MRVSVWIIARKGKRGSLYAVRWRDPSTGRMRCESCGPDRQFAKRVAERRKAELRAGIMGDTTRAGYDEFVALVLARMRRKERTLTTVSAAASVLGRFKMICAPRDVLAITTGMIELYDAERRKGFRLCADRACRWSNTAEATACWKCGRPLSVAVRPVAVTTRIKDLKILKAALARARNEYRLPVDPFAVFEWPTVDAQLPRALELNEVTKLVTVADEQWRTYIYVGIVSGMRPGELIGLMWSNVDLERGICRLRSTKANRDRLSYLDDHAVALLRTFREERRVVGPVDAPVFVRTDGAKEGAPWSAGYLVRTWHRLRDRAGVAYCAPKDLRKTCGTNLAEADVNQRIAREVTGHSTTQVLEQYYQLARIKVVRDAVTKAAAPLRRALGAG